LQCNTITSSVEVHIYKAI